MLLGSSGIHRAKGTLEHLNATVCQSSMFKRSKNRAGSERVEINSCYKFY